MIFADRHHRHSELRRINIVAWLKLFSSPHARLISVGEFDVGRSAVSGETLPPDQMKGTLAMIAVAAQGALEG